MVFAKALFLALLRKFRSGNKFPVQECWLPDAPRPPQQGRGTFLFWERGLPSHLSQMELSWMGPKIIVRNKTTRVTN
jgi:hypothetical protein